MRVGIDATCWSNPRGYGRYTRNLLSALLAERDHHEYILFVDRETFTNSAWPMPMDAQIVVVPTRVSPSAAASAAGRRSLFDMWRMAAAVGRTALDLLFFPSVYTYFPVLPRFRILLGVHDVIAEAYANQVFPSRFHRLLWLTKGWLGRSQANWIVTVSDHAQNRIIDWFRWPPQRIWVVGEAPAPIFRPLEDRTAIERVLLKQGLTPATPYIICLGGLNPHKNLTLLLEVVADLRSEAPFADLHLVLVGPAESDTFTPGVASLRQVVERLGLNAAVHFTGYIPDDEVVCFLNGALLLAMPSLEEGFGLGAVEAAACGTPVVASCNSPLPRLLEGGGFFIDPQQPQEWRPALARLITDKALRCQMGCIAQRRAEALTWQRSAQEFRALLHRIEVAGV
jgi:glycosyltransferase involved in cell wall biosynthesis